MVHRAVPTILLVGVALAATFALTGCTAFTRGFYDRQPGVDGPETATVPNPPFPPRGLAMFGGTTTRVLTWTDLMEGVRWADVIILGELHDDAVAHQVQQAVLEDAIVGWPGTVLSMEMLERDEQALIDEYLAGSITADELFAAARERSWMRNPSFRRFYLPIVDTAKQFVRPVVAANAPRSYVRMARIEGYDALRALPDEEQALFDLPIGPLANGGYEARFRALMSGDGMHGGGNEEAVTAAFRSQRMWDSTMAQSIADALSGDARRVVHLVGQFHSDFDGGLVQELQARAPFAKILVVSLRPGSPTLLMEDDYERADAVIYTGDRPSRSSLENSDHGH